jgi:hypothetical protein
VPAQLVYETVAALPSCVKMEHKRPSLFLVEIVLGSLSALKSLQSIGWPLTRIPLSGMNIEDPTVKVNLAKATHQELPSLLTYA